MRIQDAKPGDLLRDRDGDVWYVENCYAACVVEKGRAYLGSGDPRHSPRDAERFGPFALMVPAEADGSA